MYHTRSQGDTSVSLVEELRKTFCSLWQGNQTAFSPDSLFYAVWKIMPSFRGYQQQDAHEFMRYLLDHLHRELQHSRNGAAEPSSPGDGLRLASGDDKSCFRFRQKRSKDQEPGPTCTLHECLRSFTDLEELDETELYYCHKCKKRQKSTKKFWIRRLPKVLCLHLKRFHWTAFLRNKVDTYVEFPLKDLDMKGYLLEPQNVLAESCLYDLAAIVVHHGSGVGSGHYTAYGSHEGRWYHFNDSTVTLANEETLRKAKAYILFYAERSEQPAATSDACRAKVSKDQSAVDTAGAKESISERKGSAKASAYMADDVETATQ